MNNNENNLLNHLSASSIRDYMDCGLLFKFTRIDRLQFELKPSALIFGTVIHRVLAEFNEERMNANILSSEELKRRFEEYWQGSVSQENNIKYKDGQNANTLLIEGKMLLDAYYHSYPRDNFRILGIEEPFQFNIEELNLPIHGVMDLIEEDADGTIIVTDYKTAAKAYTADEIDKNFQLTLYNMAAKRAMGYGDREILLKFDCLIKTKTPKFAQYYTTRDEIAEHRAIRKIGAVWEGIQNEVFIPNDGGWRCKDCAFKSHCDGWFNN